MANVGDCEDWEAGSTQHGAEMIKLNSEKRKVKESGLHRAHASKTRVDTEAIFILPGPIKKRTGLKIL